MAVCGVFLALAAFLAPAQAKRIALVIGNDAYENVARLQKATGDARSMSDALAAIGFTVLTATDVDRAEMSRQIFEFTSRIDQNDEALLFFAGHGVRLDGRNYLLPVDVPAADVGAGDLVADSAFAADEIGDRMRRRSPRISVMILDACRDNPFVVEGADGTRAAFGETRGLSRMAAPVGTFIMFSAGERERALDRIGDDDPSPNSLFTRNLIRSITVPGRTLLAVAKEVQSEVYRQARDVAHDQAPAIYDRILGDYCLTPGPDGSCGGEGPGTGPGTQVPPNPPAPPPAAQSPCRDFLLEQALSIGTEAALDAFLAGCADGPQAALAGAALAKLQEEASPPVPPTPPAPPPGPQIAYGAGGQVAASFWDHNDSLMYLVADAERRRFYYERPCSGMIAAGARPGSLLFDGRNLQGNYYGTAYLFSTTCGQIGYDVAGTVENNGQRVVMAGRAPVRGPDCQVARYRDDRLVFNFMSRARP